MIGIAKYQTKLHLFAVVFCDTHKFRDRDFYNYYQSLRVQTFCRFNATTGLICKRISGSHNL